MFTVEHFLKSGLLPWFKVLAGESLLGERPIEYISVIELPVGDFVRGNELVISTAIGCDKDEALMLELITDVHRSQACALLLTNQTNSAEIPPCCMEYIHKHQFPVIFIPWECRFADLIEAVLGKIRDNTTADIVFYEDVQKKLLISYISNSEINCAAQILADSFCSECIIYDANHRIKGGCRLSCSRDSALCELTDKNKAIEIRTLERLYGYLYLSCGDNVNAALVNQYLITPIILWFDKERVILSAKQSERDNFVWRLAGNSPDKDKREELIEKGQLLGFNLLCQYTCVVGRIHLCDSAVSWDIAKWIASNINPVKDEILALASTLRKQIMLTYQQDLLILYLENPAIVTKQHINDFLDKLEKKMASVFPHLLFSWGISEINNDPTDFHEYYLHAKLAQELCPQAISKNMRYPYENTIIYNILSALASNEKVKNDSLSLLQPIIEYDQMNQTNLLYTLKTYLHLKNISEAARSLHLHRQSMLYRINKIEELTGLSLKDSDNAFLLEVCVRLHMRD